MTEIFSVGGASVGSEVASWVEDVVLILLLAAITYWKTHYHVIKKSQRLTTFIKIDNQHFFVNYFTFFTFVHFVCIFSSTFESFSTFWCYASWNTTPTTKTWNTLWLAAINSIIIYWKLSCYYNIYQYLRIKNRVIYSRRCKQTERTNSDYLL